MVFAADAVAVTFPDEAVRTHAPAVILLFVANTVGFLIERVVLSFGDRHFLAGASNVDKIGLLIVIVLHNESPPSAFAEMESSRHAKPYFGFLPSGTKKLLCMKKAVFRGKQETLAEYYVRAHGHLLEDVSVIEISDDGTIKIVRDGSSIPAEAY